MSALAGQSIGMLTAAECWVHPAPSTAPRTSTLTGTSRTAPWVVPTLTALKRLLSMPHNWDFYGARSIDPASVRTVIELAYELMSDNTPAPSVVPTCGGGVQLEWHIRGIDLEIEIRSPSRISACFEDERTHTEWDEEQLYDFGRLRDALRELARR